jgi:hypothetical protein
VGAGVRADRGGVAGACRLNNILKIDLNLAGRKVVVQMSIDSESETDKALLYACRMAGCPEPEVSDLMARD